MPQPGTKRAPSEPQQSPAHVPTAAAVLGAFEQICVAMSAAGAFVAIRDLEGIRSVVSYGNAPGVGTRLPLDSAFVNRCIETGEVVFRDVTSSELTSTGADRTKPELARGSRGAIAGARDDCRFDRAVFLAALGHCLRHRN